MKFFRKRPLVVIFSLISVFCFANNADANDLVLNLTAGPAPSVPKAVATRDILGLKLGMTPEQVVQIMTAEGYAPEKSEGTVSAKATGKKIASSPYVRRVTGTIKDGAKINVISVMFTSPLNGNSSYSINRYVEYNSQSGPTTAEMLALLSAKYNIEYNKMKNFEDCVLLEGQRDRPLENTIAKPEAFMFLQDTLNGGRVNPIAYYFSAGVEDDRSGRVSAIAVALLNGQGYLKDKADLQVAVRSFEERNAKHQAAPKL